MLIPVSQIFAGLLLLYAGAESLVRGSTRLALRLGMSRLVVGLTVIAFATSSPELIVGIQTSLNGQGSFVLGNMVGSNICNIALILGVSALIYPIQTHIKVIRFEIPVLLVTTILCCLLVFNRVLSPFEGVFLLSCFILYVIVSIRLARNESRASKEEKCNPSLEHSKGNILLDLVFITTGIFILMFGAHYLVRGATTVALSFNVSEAMIGLTIGAIGTSLPELAAAIVASSKRESDIIVGNVIGSNLFNILCVLAIASLIHPIKAPDIQNVDLVLMLVLAILALPIMKSGRRISRIEGAFLATLYLGYLTYRIFG
ncbi:MAG: calcium/sodium antiporter [Kiritimatiellae bacterium]|nr:calcium/sodium antiporter [Kiritimatiellia bacterium]